MNYLYVTLILFTYLHVTGKGMRELTYLLRAKSPKIKLKP